MNLKPADCYSVTLVVFCRKPAPGQGKQRIAGAIGPDPAFALSSHLLDTTLEDAIDWPGPVCIAPAADADRNWAEALPVGDHSVCPQPEGNLGERLNAVDRALRATGAERLIYIGSDSPVLDADYFALSRSALETHDVVLGPAEDGGVVLMGARCAWPELARLPWSLGDLGSRLELLCMQQGLKVKCLPARYDIDFEHDLPRLYDDLRNDPRPARRALCDWLASAGYASNRVS